MTTITATHPVATLMNKQTGVDPHTFAERLNDYGAPSSVEQAPTPAGRSCRTVREFRDYLRSEGHSDAAIRLMTTYRCNRLSLSRLNEGELTVMLSKARWMQSEGWPVTTMCNHLGVDRRQLRMLLG